MLVNILYFGRLESVLFGLLLSILIVTIRAMYYEHVSRIYTNNSGFLREKSKVVAYLYSKSTTQYRIAITFFSLCKIRNTMEFVGHIERVSKNKFRVVKYHSNIVCYRDWYNLTNILPKSTLYKEIPSEPCPYLTLKSDYVSYIHVSKVTKSTYTYREYLDLVGLTPELFRLKEKTKYSGC